MIIIGYQGIGKSTLSKKSKGFIDLESSNFFHHGKRPDDWYIYYCQIAEHLSEQGYVVFISSHEPVRNYFVNSNEKAVIICPNYLLEDEWIRKLRERYEAVPNDKNYKAWQNAVCKYHDNITELCNCGIPVIPIRTMFYDLEQIIRSAIANHPEIDLHCRQIEKIADEATTCTNDHMYKYGMRLRGYARFCQPMIGLIRHEDDSTGKYHDILIYDRPLNDHEQNVFGLDYLGEVSE